MLTKEKRIEFDETIQEFPKLFQALLNAQKYEFEFLTNNKIKQHFQKKSPIHGVYLFTDKDNNPLYVGRSRNMAVRVGTDHRATNESQANFTKKLALEKGTSMKEARLYMYANFLIQMIEIEEVHARTLFEIYATMKLETPYNSFLES